MKFSEEDLTTLLNDGETDQLAIFSSSNVSHTKVAQTLVAMANCSGGIIVIRQTDESVDTNITRDRLVDIALSVTPRLMTGIPQTMELDQQQFVVLEVPQGLPNVYAYEGHYLQRDNARNKPITPINLRRLMLERGDFSFEAEIAHQSTLDDIDWQKAEAYTKQLSGMRQHSIQDILYQRGCLTFYQDQLVPTHAGILLFGKSPQQFVRSSELTAVRFAGDKMSDTFHRQDITGTLPDQIRRAETFIADNLRKSVILKDKMKRHEDYEYPMEAVRELVVNAVAHRDYSISGDNIRLHMYSHHLEVHSPGSLPGPMTLENLKEERFSRNPIIVQILSDMGFIERLGYGVDRVIELMESQGFKAPKFINNANGFKVKLYGQNNEQEPAVNTPNQSGANQSIQHFNGSYAGKEINPRQESALVYLHKTKHSRITNSDLKAMFPDVHPETIRRDLVDLVSKNILKKMGQKRGSYYVLVQEDSND